MDADTISGSKAMSLKPSGGSFDSLQKVPVPILNPREIQGHPILPSGEVSEEMLGDIRCMFKVCAHGI
jgi:hypothetical protein